MRELDLSQSATSRHLKQLSATGYLIERRCEGAKCYALNEDRVDDTMRAISGFLNSG
jgi:DNA-binding transcriptional ArsR family regulator